MQVVASVWIPTVTARVRDFWAFYRRYTETTIHTAATASLAIFGLLIFLDPWFAAVAIGCYVVPPVVLYAVRYELPLEDDSPGETDSIGEPVAPPSPRARSWSDGESAPATRDDSEETGADRSSWRADSGEPARNRESVSGNGETDLDSDNGDTDTDSDFDGVGTDTDFDGSGTDTDSDYDGTGTDTDSDFDGVGTDTDTDPAGTDTDSDR